VRDEEVWLTDQQKPQRKVAGGVSRSIRRLLLVTGAVFMGIYVVARVHSVVMSRAALHQFSILESKGPVPGNAPSALLQAKSGVDFNLWSMKRVTAYEESLSRHFAPPLAVLKIPKLGLEVPVMEGTDDLTLNRGVGRISGTARPGEGGNLGIAGHRDGFFRGLKDIAVGDTIELDLPARTEVYRVSGIEITKPTDVQVLDRQNVPTLTLVTCYPFYFIGNAPQRYIVRATISEVNLGGKANTQPHPAMDKFRN